jgi:hypothetical protein
MLATACLHDIIVHCIPRGFSTSANTELKTAAFLAEDVK